MSPVTKFLIKHSIRLEIYGLIVLVPLGVYFVIIAGNYENDKLLLLLYSAIIGLLPTTILGIIVRVKRLMPNLKIMYNIPDDNVRKKSLRDIKIFFLHYPHFESILILFRWVTGSFIANFALYNFTGSYETTIFALAVSFLAPTAYILFFFATENNLSKILSDKKLSGIFLPPESYKTTSLFYKIISIVISIIIIPVVILGYFLYLSNYEGSTFTNIYYHLIFISAQSLLVIFFLVYEAMANLRLSLHLQMENLEKMRKGEYDIHQPMLSCDEISITSQYITILADSLKDYKEKNDDLTMNLEKKVESRTEEILAAVEELRAINDELISIRNKLWSEMEIARRIQTVLLPEEPAMEGYDITAHMETADEVGGDYYDIINIEEINWLFIGDVSGHGVPAGLIMMMVQSCIRSHVMEDPHIKPSELLRIVNRVISHNIRIMHENKFMTITAFAVKEDGNIVFSGRHEDLIVYRASSQNIEIIKTDGICLSPWKLGHKQKNLELQLNPGDTLFLYTDGITEAWEKNNTADGLDPEKNMYGDKRLINLISGKGHLSTNEICDAVIDDLKSFLTIDDFTMVILKKL